MKMLLLKFVLFLITRTSIQEELVKLATYAIEFADEEAKKTSNKVDDAIVSFAKRNKESLLNILVVEAEEPVSKVDAKLVEVVKKLK